MSRWLLASLVVAACAKSEPPVAPVVALDVPPMADAGVSAPIPPPNPERYVPEGDPAESGGRVDDVPPPNGTTSYFDRGAAAFALGGVQVSRCAQPGGPTGPGHVTVTFEPSGRVASASVDQGPYGGTAVGGCIARVFGAIRVPPFQGAPVRVGKSFLLR